MNPVHFRIVCAKHLSTSCLIDFFFFSGTLLTRRLHNLSSSLKGSHSCGNNNNKMGRFVDSFVRSWLPPRSRQANQCASSISFFSNSAKCVLNAKGRNKKKKKKSWNGMRISELYCWKKRVATECDNFCLFSDRYAPVGIPHIPRMKKYQIFMLVEFTMFASVADLRWKPKENEHFSFLQTIES